jgi:hypothetical protein
MSNEEAENITKAYEIRDAKQYRQHFLERMNKKMRNRGDRFSQL